MELDLETAALIALLRSGRRSWSAYAAAVEAAEGARPVLEAEQGLLAESALAEAMTELAGWKRRNLTVVSLLDERYPLELRRVADAPPLLFVAGELLERDIRSVAVVGTRQPSARGRQLARTVTHRLVDAGWTVVSGLAAGIDTVAHETALRSAGRTVAVVGTGLDHCYPRENADLQRRVAGQGAVLSRFWPESRPSRRAFPLRNGLMAGLTQASVIVEAGAMSGTRILARHALAEGRLVLVHEELLAQPWARELADRPGVHVFDSSADALDRIERVDQQALAV
jgi:DNA processing protein